MFLKHLVELQVYLIGKPKVVRENSITLSFFEINFLLTYISSLIFGNPIVI